MSSIELLQLPDIVLARIFSFVPDRFEVATVCRRFYELICETERKPLEITIGLHCYDESDHESIINSKRIGKIMKAFMDVENSKLADQLKEVFQVHGSSIITLDWTNWKKFIYSESTLLEMLNYFPNLEELELSSWDCEITKDLEQEVFMKLPKLKTLILKNCNENIVKFLTKHLPKNILKHLTIHNCEISADLLRKLTENQASITSFDGERDFDHGNFLENLKLTSLRVHLDKNYGEDHNPLRPVLMSLIKSQPNLKFLDILDDNDYTWKLVDDDIFLEMCKIKSLETLKVNFSGVAPACIQNFSKLTNLKNFETLTCTVQVALNAFAELSLIKTVPLERFEMRLWDVDLPVQTFQQFGQNYNSLKHLEIKLGTWHKLNFFMQSFPGLETLKIRFGEANRNVSFSEAYEDDGLDHVNIKKLSLEIFGRDGINDVPMFFKMVRAFPNLEKLKISSSLPFTDEFFQNLQLNLGKIRELEMLRFDVEADIVFTDVSIQVLRDLSKTLKYGFFEICNVENSFMRRRKEPQGGRTKADFKPLSEGLKDFYKIREDGYCTNVVTNLFILTVGKKSEW